jgi:hypothetical protein
MNPAVVAAHGLTAGMVKTWSPRLPRTPRLLVPVQLDVLMVREERRWARTAMAVPTTADATSEQLAPEPFAELSEPRARGAYLHWALPDVLTRGQPVTSTRGQPVTSGSAGDGGNDDEATQFPAVPDRWLVVRISETTGTRAVRGWVLRAGDAVPEVVPLDQWVESELRRGEMEQPLTALGHGDPAFTAYFDNVLGRMSFHDALEDVTAGPIAYLVCGWFADAGMDPLAFAPIDSIAAFERRLADLAWRLPTVDLQPAVAMAARTVRAATEVGLAVEVSPLPPLSPTPTPGDPTTAWPVQTLFHGSAVSIPWPAAGGASEETGGPPSVASIDVALGATAAETVAAMVVSARPDIHGALVEAFYGGMLAELDRPGGPSRIDERLHRQGFASEASGTTTEWIWQTPPEPTPRPPRPAEHAPLSGVLVAARRSPLEAAFQPRIGVLRDVIAKPADAPAPPATGGWVQVPRALPRWFHAADPVLLLSGARRSARHGGDGRFDPEGRLACRISGSCVQMLAASEARGTQRVAVRGPEVLARALDNGSVPFECEELLQELALLDPGSAPAAARAVAARTRSSDEASRERAQRFAVEQTAWWALRDGDVDADRLVRFSGLAGTLPSPLAVTPPRRPWNPIHADYEVEVRPALRPGDDWALEEIDTEAVDAAALELGEPIVIRGRCLLTAAAPRSLASRARQTMTAAARVGTATELPVGHVARFASDVAGTLLGAIGELQVVDAHPSGDGRADDVADALDDLDLLTGSLSGLRAKLAAAVQSSVVAGTVQVRRLRLVDGFGQFVDVVGDGVHPRALLWSRRMQLEGASDTGELRPRFTTPARALLRYMDGGGGSEEAGLYGPTPDDLRTVSPLCGFLAMNHLDGTLQYFAPDGRLFGAITRGQHAPTAWENAPGRVTLVGQTPSRSISNPFLGGMADALVQWSASEHEEAETAAEALMRLLDATLWSVEPFAWLGDDRSGLLLGQPVAVLRARIHIEVRDIGATRLARDGRVAVRLGALTQPGDGLLGYYVDDDYRTLRACHRACTELARDVGPGRGFLRRIDLVGDLPPAPIEHPYIDRSGLLWVQPGRDTNLTLLVEPYAAVHATVGALPRKRIGMRRAWLEAGLRAMAPAFRFGPVLVDPAQIRMPVPSGGDGTWSWSHRVAVGRWASDAVVNATGDATLSDDPAIASEGWLVSSPGEAGGGS